MRRRTFLASGIGTVGMLGATLPRAHEDATLAADLAVTDVTWTRVEKEYGLEASGLSVWVHSRIDEPIEPVVLVWGRYRWMMQSWPILEGPDRIDPGEDVELHVTAPDEATQLYPQQSAQVTVVQKGTERRAKTTFVPAEVDSVIF